MPPNRPQRGRSEAPPLMKEKLRVRILKRECQIHRAIVVRIQWDDGERP